MPTIEQARNWYPDDDPVHGIDHVLRVYSLAERLAQLEGADLEIVLAAVLLHDAQANPMTGGENAQAQRKNHHLDSAELARRILEAEGWSEERVSAVGHCIQAHRFRDRSESPQTLEAKVVFDADKLDAIGAVGAARAIAYAVTAGQPFYALPSDRFLETGQLEPGERHSAYHEFLFKLVKIHERLYTSSGKQLAQERQRRMVEFFDGLAQEICG